MKGSNGVWWLVALAAGASAAVVPQTLSPDSVGMAFVLLICYALIACLLLGYLKSQGAWLWAFIFVVGIVAAMIVTSIPMSEPLTKGVLMTAILQQQDHAVNILAAAIAAFIGAALGGAMSGRS